MELVFEIIYKQNLPGGFIRGGFSIEHKKLSKKSDA